jgi:phage/conjugal plasmid C-4 type zinc finger TraR family protein
MDSVDEAQLLEEFERMEALHRLKAFAGPDEPEWRDPENPLVLCQDCDSPIPAARLLANPRAVRCIDCQIEYEREQRLYSLAG